MTDLSLFVVEVCYVNSEVSAGLQILLPFFEYHSLIFMYLFAY